MMISRLFLFVSIFGVAVGLNEWRVNVGGQQYVDSQGFTWEPSTAYVSGGQTYSVGDDVDITGTTDDTLYRTELYGDFSLDFTTTSQPNKPYDITFYFAEIYPPAAPTGERVFDIKIEDIVRLARVDIGSKVGVNAAYEVTVTVIVTGNDLKIETVTRTQNPKISAVWVRPSAVGTPVDRINCGGPEYIDGLGNLWQDTFDIHGTGSTNTFSTVSAIDGTNDDELYQTERWGTFTYEIPARDNIWYDVTFLFAEIYADAANQRKFSVKIDGTDAVTDIDVFVAAGGKNKAYSPAKSTILSTSNVISIATVNGGIDNPKISAIYVRASTDCTLTPKPLGCPTNGGADGDPVIYGFLGEKLWFNGHAGGIFNVYNDEFINVNALFSEASTGHGTVMSTIAMEMGGHKISVDVSDKHSKHSVVATIDGNKQHVNDSKVIYLDGCVEVVVKSGFLSVRDPRHDIKITPTRPHKRNTHITHEYLDLNMNAPTDEDAHLAGGFLGQTAAGLMEREERLFLVDNLYSTVKSSFYKRTMAKC